MNTRTFLIAISLMVIFAVTAGWVAARTETDSTPADNASDVSESQEQTTDLENTYNIPSYRSQFGECFDVPVSDAASCRDTGQSAARPSPTPIDECYDVSIIDIASCRALSEAPAP